MDFKKILPLILLILFANLISADFSVGNKSHDVDGLYGIGENIRGWINMSFDDESGDSLFEDSFGNSIALFDLLNKNPEVNFSCKIAGCASEYAGANPSAEKEFMLEEGEIGLAGINFDSNFEDIISVEFEIESDAGESCYPQIGIDFNSDGKIDTSNYKSTGETCSQTKTYGCFNISKGGFAEGNLGSIPYCQRLTLPASPGFSFGAWLRRDSSEPSNMTIKLYDSSGNDLGKSCKLPNATAAGGEISCDINHAVSEEEDYFICIYGEGGTNLIRGYTTSDGCAYHEEQGWGIPETAAFQIFATGKKFSPVGTIKINNSVLSSGTIAARIKNYIVNAYGSLNCEQGCIVPISIVSGTEQTAAVRDLNLVYSLGSGLQDTITQFSDVKETAPDISSDFIKLNLDGAGFEVNSEEDVFELSFAEQSIFSEDISVRQSAGIAGLSPLVTASAFPTTFTAIMESNSSYTYSWAFGDGGTATTKTNQAEHTYSSTGTYTLKLTVTGNSTTSTKTFNISVGSPKNVIKELLDKKSNDAENVKSELSEFDEFSQDTLNSILDLLKTEELLKRMKDEFDDAVGEDDYNTILTDLLTLEIPESVVIQFSSNGLTFFPNEELIDLDVLAEITGEDYDGDNEDEYTDAVLFWNQQNMETKLGFNEFSATYPGYETSILRVFEMNIEDNGGISDHPYLIIKSMDDMNFAENYLEEEMSGYYYIYLERGEQKIVFSTTEDLEFEDLPAFISPALDRLSLTEDLNISEDEKSIKWVILFLILVLVFIIGFIAYVVMQEWYKRKYEAHLFKNRNNLYNLLLFIENSRKKGIADNEIEKKLKKAKWGGEQIGYAMKKHAGKRTGMIELPVGKIMDFLGIGNKDAQQTKKFYK